MVGNASVTLPDLLGRDGIVHIMSGLLQTLPPPAGQPAPELAAPAAAPAAEAAVPAPSPERAPTPVPALQPAPEPAAAAAAPAAPAATAAPPGVEAFAALALMRLRSVSQASGGTGRHCSICGARSGQDLVPAPAAASSRDSGTQGSPPAGPAGSARPRQASATGSRRGTSSAPSTRAHQGASCPCAGTFSCRTPAGCGSSPDASHRPCGCAPPRPSGVAAALVPAPASAHTSRAAGSRSTRGACASCRAATAAAGCAAGCAHGGNCALGRWASTPGHPAGQSECDAATATAAGAAPPVAPAGSPLAPPAAESVAEVQQAETQACSDVPTPDGFTSAQQQASAWGWGGGSAARRQHLRCNEQCTCIRPFDKCQPVARPSHHVFSAVFSA